MSTLFRSCKLWNSSNFNVTFQNRNPTGTTGQPRNQGCEAHALKCINIALSLPVEGVFLDQRLKIMTSISIWWMHVKFFGIRI